MTIDFEHHRTHLRGVAYRMLGSLAEADDAVQEAWLRLERAAPSDVTNPRGWLTTVVSRISLDMLRARTARREDPLDPRDDRPAPTAVDQERELADSVGLALLVVLDKLEPAERIAFVLHDLSGLPFDEIAAILGRSPDATRQLGSRARRRIQGSRPPDAELESQRGVVAAFIAALRTGNLEGLLAVLDPDVVVQSTDDAGAVRESRGARTWATGAAAYGHLANRMDPTPALLDGAVGVAMAPKGRLVRALRFTFTNGLIAHAELITDRARLDALEVTPIDAVTTASTE